MSKIGFHNNTLYSFPAASIPLVLTNYRHNTFGIRGCDNKYSTDYDFDFFAISTA